MKIEFEKQFGEGTDPWYAKAERWAKKQRFPISFLLLGIIDYLKKWWIDVKIYNTCLLYTSPSPRDRSVSRMPSSA